MILPAEPLLSTKGIAVALADGISSSSVSAEASHVAVSGFLADYYCTSEALSVRRSVNQVLRAINAWLYSHSRNSPFRYEQDRGYVCTFSAVVFKSATAHLFHAGDARIYRLARGELEQLTEDHRVWLQGGQSYLGRALGVNSEIEFDYRAVTLEAGDQFLLLTDGVHEHVDDSTLKRVMLEHAGDPDTAARVIADEAFQRGSPDNLTVQVVNIDRCAVMTARELHDQLTALPFPPELRCGAEIDGFRIVRELQVSHRSHVFLAVDIATEGRVVLKTPSVDLRADSAYLERFLLEEWIARRIDNPYVLKAYQPGRRRTCLYSLTEYVEGCTLTQWMNDNPMPTLETVRAIIEQIARALRAFHRLDMLHQDLRPDNVLIDKDGKITLIDFGSTRVPGLEEIETPLTRNAMLGTAQYTAPEYLLGEPGSARSDQFSLGVITYQLLSRHLPYGLEVVKARSRAAQQKLRYRTLLHDKREIPAWIDHAVSTAVHPDPMRRYEEISEFLVDLRRPAPEFLSRTSPPLIERNPVLFWQCVSLVLFILLAMSLV